MDKAKLELRSGAKEGLNHYVKPERPKAGLPKLRSTNNLVKTAGSTMACHEVGHIKGLFKFFPLEWLILAL